jgi:hypothetical protein
MPWNDVLWRPGDEFSDASVPALVAVWRIVTDFVLQWPPYVRRVFGTEGCRFESCRAYFF